MRWMKVLHRVAGIWRIRCRWCRSWKSNIPRCHKLPTIDDFRLLAESRQSHLQRIVRPQSTAAIGVVAPDGMYVRVRQVHACLRYLNALLDMIERRLSETPERNDSGLNGLARENRSTTLCLRCHAYHSLPRKRSPRRPLVRRQSRFRLLNQKPSRVFHHRRRSRYVLICHPAVQFE